MVRIKYSGDIDGRLASCNGAGYCRIGKERFFKLCLIRLNEE